MAWSVIADSVLQVGRPIRALTLRLLRDNITALANGDAGAPRIQRVAIQPGSLTGAELAANTLSSFNLQVGANERDWVMGLFAAQVPNQVGTLVLAYTTSTISEISYGSNYAGSSLTAASLRVTGGAVEMQWAGSVLPGTWRALGSSGFNVDNKLTLFMRVA